MTVYDDPFQSGDFVQIPHCPVISIPHFYRFHGYCWKMLMNQISPTCCLRQQTNEFRDSDFHQEVAKESDCHQ